MLSDADLRNWASSNKSCGLTNRERKIEMPSCKNPECGKNIPEGKKYCDETCLKRHLDLKLTPKLTSEEDIWLGQERRKRAMETIQKLARELCPTSYKRFACTVSYRTGLSYRKITDDYLVVLLQIGILKRKENTLTVRDDSDAS